MLRHIVMFIDPLDLTLAAHCADIPAPIGESTYTPGQYPRFDLFCKFQLYVPTYPEARYNNAKVIAKAPDNVTLIELLMMGWSQCTQ